jgi:hypothetical protein
MELCKKLSEIGFPETENICFSLLVNPEWAIQIQNKKDILWTAYISYKCPSVMEMLDEILEKLGTLDCIEIWFDDNKWTSFIKYLPTHTYIHWYSLPNALAEMILWLHENNYISFSK